MNNSLLATLFPSWGATVTSNENGTTVSAGIGSTQKPVPSGAASVGSQNTNAIVYLVLGAALVILLFKK